MVISSPPGLLASAITAVCQHHHQEDLQKQRAHALKQACEAAKQRAALQLQSSGPVQWSAGADRCFQHCVTLCREHNHLGHFNHVTLSTNPGDSSGQLILASLALDLQARLRECARSAADDHLTQSCARELEEIARQRFGPEWHIMPFGSAVNGFGTSDADLDVSVYSPDRDLGNGKLTGHVDTKELLQTLLSALKDHTKFQITDVVWSAKIPIAKLRFEDALDVDLSCQNVEPWENTRLLRAYSSCFPMVRDLGILVKLWAKTQKLSGAPEGHLSSYTWTLMVIYFLQVDPSVKLPRLDSKTLDLIYQNPEAAIECGRRHFERCGEPLVNLVFGFFQFFATDFQWGFEVVSVRLGNRLRRDDPVFARLPGCCWPRLHVEDPFLLDKNLNYVLGDYQEKMMHKCLLDSFVLLQGGCTPYGLSPVRDESQIGKVHSPLKTLSQPAWSDEAKPAALRKGADKTSITGTAPSVQEVFVRTGQTYACKGKKLKNAKLTKQAESKDTGFKQDLGPDERRERYGTATSAAIAICDYVAEADGYLSVSEGEQVWALIDSPEDGEPGCSWKSYIYACRCDPERTSGWVPFEIMVWLGEDGGAVH